LLAIGAWHQEAGKVAPDQFLAECGKPRWHQRASVGIFERLEMSFEHCSPFTSCRTRIVP
jgi:hypothetical protein